MSHITEDTLLLSKTNNQLTIQRGISYNEKTKIFEFQTQATQIIPHNSKLAHINSNSHFTVACVKPLAVDNRSFYFENNIKYTFDFYPNTLNPKMEGKGHSVMNIWMQNLANTELLKISEDKFIFVLYNSERALVYLMSH